MALFEFHADRDRLWEALRENESAHGLSYQPLRDGWFKVCAEEAPESDELSRRFRVTDHVKDGVQTTRIKFDVRVASLQMAEHIFRVCFALFLIIGAIVWCVNSELKAFQAATLQALAGLIFGIKWYRALNKSTSAAEKETEHLIEQLTVFKKPGLNPIQLEPLKNDHGFFSKVLVILFLGVLGHASWNVTFVFSTIAMLVLLPFIVATFTPRSIANHWRSRLYLLALYFSWISSAVLLTLLLLWSVYFMACDVVVHGPMEGDPDASVLAGLIVSPTMPPPQEMIRDFADGFNVYFHKYLLAMFQILPLMAILISLIPLYILMNAVFKINRQSLSSRERDRRLPFQFPRDRRFPKRHQLLFGFMLVPIVVMNWIGVMCGIGVLLYAVGATFNPVPQLYEMLDFYYWVSASSVKKFMLPWRVALLGMLVLSFPAMILFLLSLLRFVLMTAHWIGGKMFWNVLSEESDRLSVLLHSALSGRCLVMPEVVCVRSNRLIIHSEPATLWRKPYILISDRLLRMLSHRSVLALLLHEARHTQGHIQSVMRLKWLSLFGLFPNWTMLMLYDFQNAEDEADAFAIECMGESKSLEDGVLLLIRHRNGGRPPEPTTFIQKLGHWLGRTSEQLKSLLWGVYGASYEDPVVRIQSIRKIEAQAG